jgi:hypothetical protein
MFLRILQCLQVYCGNEATGIPPSEYLSAHALILQAADRNHSRKFPVQTVDNTNYCVD